jgi:hypothetical protein
VTDYNKTKLILSAGVDQLDQSRAEAQRLGHKLGSTAIELGVVQQLLVELVREVNASKKMQGKNPGASWLHAAEYLRRKGLY